MKLVERLLLELLNTVTTFSASQYSYCIFVRSVWSPLVARALRALVVNNGRAGLVVFLLGNAPLWEGGRGGQNGAPDPGRVLLLWWINDLTVRRGHKLRPPQLCMRVTHTSLKINNVNLTFMELTRVYTNLKLAQKTRF